MATHEQEATPQYLLRFISGKYRGREFPLEVGRDIVVGRLGNVGLGLVIADDTVSRNHAKIRTEATHVTVEDLGSSTGTFVNGEPVASASLKDGDEIRIGGSVIQLIHAKPPEPERLMSGSLRVVPLPDLVQLLANAHKSGVLTIRGDQGVGHIRLREGKIYHASIENSPLIRPRKAFYRMLRWASGTFDLAPADNQPVAEEISETTVALMLEGMLQVDELGRLEKELPPGASPVTTASPLPGTLKDLSAEELTVFQLVLHHRTVQSVLDHYPGTDLEACGHLLALLHRGYIVRG